MIPVEELRVERPLPVGGRRSAVLFLKGPIDWPWIERCARLPGKALHVGMVIRLLSGMKRSKTVRLAPKFLRGVGVKRHAAYRALRGLECAELVAVKRRRGAAPLVTVVESRNEGADRHGGRFGGGDEG